MRWIWVVVFFSFTYGFPYHRLNPVIPVSEFRIGSPVRHQISLSGAFAEIRNNHFHAGIDIRSSRGVDGDDLLSVADGYISKIEISGESYGKMVYINHPGGYTSVYAHLQKFREDIQAYIKSEQYKQQKFEVELELDPFMFPIKQGEHFGYMGNTGASRGTHVHFEMRETFSQKAINPLIFGLYVEDEMAPIIRRMKAYHFDDTRNIVHSANIFQKQLAKQNNCYYSPTQLVAFGLDAIDQMPNTWFKIGISKIEIALDGGVYYKYNGESFLLSDTRYINAHIDYDDHTSYRGKMHRCFKLPGNNLQCYETLVNDGILFLEDTLVHEVSVRVLDSYGNTKTHDFQVQYRAKEIPVKTERQYPYTIPYQHSYEVRHDNIELKMDAGAVYEEEGFEILTQEQIPANHFSKIYKIGPRDIPIHHDFEIHITPDVEIPEDKIGKVFVACRNGNRLYNVGSYWIDNKLTGRFNQFGEYFIYIDTIAPSIVPISFRANMSKQKSVSFGINDNIYVKGCASKLKYDAYIDGQWVLMEYEGKTKTIKHVFEESLLPGEHTLLVRVQDDRGNVKEFDKTFIR